MLVSGCVLDDSRSSNVWRWCYLKRLMQNFKQIRFLSASQKFLVYWYIQAHFDYVFPQYDVT